MGSFFLFILIVILAIIAMVGGAVLRVVRVFTKQTNAFNQGQSTNNSRYRDQQNQQAHNDNHQKIFGKEEGEYIDYEDIK